MKSNGITPQVAQQHRIKRIQEVQLGSPVVTAAERKAEQLKRNRTIGEIADMYFETRGSNLNSLKGCKTDKCRCMNLSTKFFWLNALRLQALPPRAVTLGLRRQ